ncbi:MAG: PAS domain S-box protein [Bacteroidota bacterium]
MESILKLLTEKTKVEFVRYKKSTLDRRIQKRMDTLGLKSMDSYHQMLKDSPGELDELYQVMMIGVTEFFRDQEAFENLSIYLKKVVDHKNRGESIRIWSAGCASGQEAYSIAIILSEILEDHISQYDIKIFASDISQKALQIGRKGWYDTDAVKNVSALRLKHYFKAVDGGYQITDSLRKMVIFADHDVTHDPPFTGLDLLCCRNLLIYFDEALQVEVFDRFCYSLNEGGYLFLGKSENVKGHEDSFKEVAPEDNIFEHVTRPAVSVPWPNIKNVKKHRNSDDWPNADRHRLRSSLSLIDQAQDTIARTFRLPYLIVNQELVIEEVYGSVELYTKQGSSLSSKGLLSVLQPVLKSPTEKIIKEVLEANITISTEVIEYFAHEEKRFVRVTVKPMHASSGSDYFIIIFDNIPAFHAFGNTYEQLPDEVHLVQQELQATKQKIEAYQKELTFSHLAQESLNQALQKANEELTIANEELEASNEELQSLNEELFATNADLRQVNEELKVKEWQLLKSKESILKSEQLFKNSFEYAPIGKALISDKGQWLKVNQEVVNITGYTEEELLRIDFQTITHPDDLEKDLSYQKKMISGEIDRFNMEKRYIRKDGQVVWVLLDVSTLKDEDGKPSYFISQIQNINDRKTAEAALLSSEEKYRQIVETANEGILILNQQGIISLVNPKMTSILGCESQEIISQSILDFTDEEGSERIKMLLSTEHTSSQLPEIKLVKKSGASVWAIAAANRISLDNAEANILMMVTDVTERKQAQQELIMSERKFRSLIENGYDVIMLHNAQGIMEYASPSLKRVLGYEEHEVLGTRPHEFLHPDFIEYSNQQYTELMKQPGKTAFLHQRFRHKEGHYIWTEASVTNMLDVSGVNGFVSNFKDITDKKETEDKLRSNQQLLSSISKNVNEAIYRSTENKGLIYVNEVFIKMFGYSSQEEVSQVNPTDLYVHKEQRNQLLDALRNKGYFSNKEVLLKKKNGHVFWGLMSNTITKDEDGNVYLDGAIRDITKQREAVYEIDLANDQIRGILESVQDSVFALDTKLRYISFNQNHKAMMKDFHDADIQIGQNIFNYISDENERQIIQEQCMKALDGEGLTIETSYGVGTPIERFVEISTNVIRSNDGDIVGVAVFVKDISERKLTEKKLRELNTELKEQNDKLEKREDALKRALGELSDRNFELDQLVYKTSHDLRSPLSSILGLVNVAKLDPSTESKGQYLERIEGRIHKLDEFVKSMLSYAKANRTEISFEPLDLKTMLTESIKDLEYLDNFSRVNTSIKVEGDHSFCSDRIRVNIILANITSNAFKYYDPNKEENYLKINIQLEEKMAVVTFEDNGIGIEDELQQHVFDMFFRATEKSEGSGLGMYIVKQSVEKLNGHITINSKYGQGTTIKVSIPNRLNWV